MPPRLRIAIDPRLARPHGPEVAWTWRMLLSGIGFAWEEVPYDSAACDVAYGIDPLPAIGCRLYVRADAGHWEQPSRPRLEAVGDTASGRYPIYAGETGGPDLLREAGGALVYNRDLIFDVFALTTGQEERHWPKNAHGHFDLSRTPAAERGIGRLALASDIGCGVQAALARVGVGEPMPRWPGGKRAAACVSHDVDYPEVVRWLEPLRILRRQGWSGFRGAAGVLLGRRAHWGFPAWMRAEQAANIRSAFYFAARQGSLLEYATGTPDPFYDVRSPRFRALFRDLADGGFEIGLHASYRACESAQTFAAEKQALEDASGQPVAGNRHHYWHLDPDDPESTLLIHERVGLRYDTSLAHERYVGWRRGSSWPFFPFHQKERRELRTLQICTAWMDDQLFGHAADNPGEPAAVLRGLADRAAAHGGCLNVDVHDYVFDDVLFPGWARACHELVSHLIARSDFWIDTPGRIAEHWTQRHAAILRESRGLQGA